MPAALCAQHREGALGQVDHAHQVRLELCAERVERHVLHAGEIGVAGVVDDDVEPAVGVQCGLHGSVCGGRVGDVEFNRVDVAAEPRHEVGQLLRASRRGDDLVAGLESGHHDVAAEPARGLPVTMKT